MNQSATPQRIATLLFDLDGTLVDSRRDIAASVNWALAEQGLPPRSLAEVTRFIGDGMPQLLERSLGMTEAEPLATTMALFRQHYWTHCLDATTVYPGVRDVLEAWRERPLAVVTNKPYDVSMLILQGLALAPYFRAVIGGETASEKKPHPAPLLEAIRQCETTPPHCVMVGDHPNDIRAGRAAGVTTCAVTYGLSEREALVAFQPDVVVDHAAELLSRFCAC